MIGKVFTSVYVFSKKVDGQIWISFEFSSCDNSRGFSDENKSYQMKKKL
jgi:hypothetical protein